MSQQKIKFNNTKRFVLFIFCMGFSLLVAFLYLRHSPAKYLVSVTIPLKKINYSKDRQIVYLKSKDLLEKAEKNARLEADYFMPATLGATEIDEEECPVAIDLLKNDLTSDKTLEIKIIDQKVFRLSMDDVKEINGFGEKIIKSGLQFTLKKKSFIEPETVIVIKITNLNKLTDNYSGKLKIALSSDSGKCTLSLSQENPTKAVRLLKEISTLYFNYLNLSINKGRDTASFTTVTAINNQLDSINQDLSAYKKQIYLYQDTTRKKITAAPPPPVDEDDQIDKDSLRKQLDILNTISSYVKIPTYKFSFVPNTFDLKDNNLQKLINKLNNLQIQKQELLQTEKPDSEPLLRATNEVITLKDSITKSIDSLKWVIINLLDTSKKNISEDEPDKGPTFEDTLTSLRTEQRAKTKLYDELMRKKAAILSKLPVADRVIVNGLPISIHPDKKPVTLILSLAFIAGLTFPLLFIFLKTGKQTALTESEYLNQTTIPVIGTLNIYRRKNKIIPPVEYETLLGSQFTAIRNNIESLDNHKLIAFSSLNPGEGKSFVAANVAALTARTGKKVLLIQTNTASFTNELLEEDAPKGLSDFLADRDLLFEEIIYPTKTPSLSLIMAGQGKTDTVSTLKSLIMKKLIREATVIFDFVFVDIGGLNIRELIDLPGIKPDILINVLRKNITSSQDFNALITDITDNNIKDIYLIINHIT